LQGAITRGRPCSLRSIAACPKRVTPWGRVLPRRAPVQEMTWRQVLPRRARGHGMPWRRVLPRRAPVHGMTRRQLDRLRLRSYEVPERWLLMWSRSIGSAGSEPVRRIASCCAPASSRHTTLTIRWPPRPPTRRTIALPHHPECGLCPFGRQRNRPCSRGTPDEGRLPADPRQNCLGGCASGAPRLQRSPLSPLGALGVARSSVARRRSFPHACGGPPPLGRHPLHGPGPEGPWLQVARYLCCAGRSPRLPVLACRGSEGETSEPPNDGFPVVGCLRPCRSPCQCRPT
jgi:hypothetical protein